MVKPLSANGVNKTDGELKGNGEHRGPVRPHYGSEDHKVGVIDPLRYLYTIWSSDALRWVHGDPRLFLEVPYLYAQFLCHLLYSHVLYDVPHGKTPLLSRRVPDADPLRVHADVDEALGYGAYCLVATVSGERVVCIAVGLDDYFSLGTPHKFLEAAHQSKCFSYVMFPVICPHHGDGVFAVLGVDFPPPGFDWGLRAWYGVLCKRVTNCCDISGVTFIS